MCLLYNYFSVGVHLRYMIHAPSFSCCRFLSLVLAGFMNSSCIVGSWGPKVGIRCSGSRRVVLIATMRAIIVMIVLVRVSDTSSNSTDR